MRRKTTNRLRAIETEGDGGEAGEQREGRKTTTRLRAIETVDVCAGSHVVDESQDN